MTPERTSSLNTTSIKNASILVVDDEEGMRHFITKVLEPHCKRVMQAASAKEAGAMMDTHHFDLLMVDNLMPEQTAEYLFVGDGFLCFTHHSFCIFVCRSLSQRLADYPS